MPRTTEASPESSNTEKLVSANTQFAVSLFKNLSSEKSDNIFISPASISIAMAMTYLGAREDSAKELGKVLGFDQVPEDDLHPSFSRLRQALQKTEDKYQLKTANRLYCDKSYSFLEEFLLGTKLYYGAELAAVNFSLNFDGARQEINSWVEEQTEQKIVDLLPPGSLNALTRLVLVNAIYFKGDWELKFDVNDTRRSSFYITRDEKVKVPMMYKKDQYRYGRLRGEHSKHVECQAVELPYTDERLSMFVFLPSEEHGITALMSELRSEHFTEVERLFHMHSRDVKVYLPKFKLEESFSLRETFEALGVNHIFSEASDLSGIDGTRELYVSKIVHKAFIDVNEEGSEAAAATAVEDRERCRPRIHEFRADHPFIFMIRDNFTRAILFLGKYSRPKLEG